MSAETVTVDLLGQDVRGTVVESELTAAFGAAPSDRVVVDVAGTHWIVDEADIKPNIHD